MSDSSDTLSSYSKITSYCNDSVEPQPIDCNCLHGKRKSKHIVKLLISHYFKYEGHWDDNHFKEVLLQTGFTKKQLNKWFWDRREKERHLIEAKKLTYPGIVFQITDCNTGKDLTPDFVKLCQKPIFSTKKISKTCFQ